jgi:hypothetical protein
MDTATKTSPVSVAASKIYSETVVALRKSQFPTNWMLATSLLDFPVESVTVSRNI